MLWRWHRAAHGWAAAAGGRPTSLKDTRAGDVGRDNAGACGRDGHAGADGCAVGRLDRTAYARADDARREHAGARERTVRAHARARVFRQDADTRPPP